MEMRGLNLLKRGLKYNNPVYKLRNNRQQVDLLYKELKSKMERKLDLYKKYSGDLENKLKLLNPTLALEKGNAIILNEAGGLIKSVKDLAQGDSIEILMQDGRIRALVKDVLKGEEEDGY